MSGSLGQVVCQGMMSRQGLGAGFGGCVDKFLSANCGHVRSRSWLSGYLLFLFRGLVFLILWPTTTTMEVVSAACRTLT